MLRTFMKRLSFYWTDGPNNMITEATPSPVNENEPVTFSCSARGQPYPTFSWFKDEKLVSTLAQWKETTIVASQTGSYMCVARNRHGVGRSQVNINVQCKSVQYFTIWNLF